MLDRVALQIGRPDLLRLGACSASPSEPPLLIPQVERLRAEVGWRPHFGLDEGICDTVAWWRAKLTRAAGESEARP